MVIQKAFKNLNIEKIKNVNNLKAVWLYSFLDNPKQSIYVLDKSIAKKHIIFLTVEDFKRKVKR